MNKYSTLAACFLLTAACGSEHDQEHALVTNAPTLPEQQSGSGGSLADSVIAAKCVSGISQEAGEARGLTMPPEGLRLSLMMTVHNGVVLASGAVGVIDAMYSGDVAYGSNVPGAMQGEIHLIRDTAGSNNGGYWRLSLDSTLKFLTATYTDEDLSGGQTSFTFPPAECVMGTTN